MIFPGYDGGAEWGGSAFDPDSGLLFVNANDLPWTGALAPNTPAASGARPLHRPVRRSATAPPDGRAPLRPHRHQFPPDRRTDHRCHPAKASAACPASPTSPPAGLRALVQYVITAVPDSRTRPASPFDLTYRFTGYKKFLDPDGYPAVAPPWGTLNAINLNTGEFAWKIPLGEYPELAAKGIKDTGSENYGGPIVTAGGLVFIAATNLDRKLRAFDKDTGKLLWETVMPSSANCTPATYEIDGRQYIAAAGGKSPTGGTQAYYIAFALPE